MAPTDFQSNDRGEPTGSSNEPVEFEKYPVEVQECRNITDHFRRIYRIYPNLIKENQRMSTCNQSNSQTLGSQPVVMPKNLPDHCSKVVTQSAIIVRDVINTAHQKYVGELTTL